jgi:glycosyltransferase involved in cell wall biosynthesis
VKVLITHERFLPDFGGGGELIVAHTASALAKRSVHVRVLTTGNPELKSYEGIETVRMPISRYRMNLSAGRIHSMAREADLIHTFNYHACLPSWAAGWRLGKPVVCTCLGLFGDTWLSTRGRLIGRTYRAWERFLVTRPYARTLFLSEFSRRDGFALGVPAERARVSAPGFAPENCAPSPVKDDVVLFAGKFEKRKGVLDALEVARALPQVRFRMIGWGPETEYLKRGAPANLEIGERETGATYSASLARARIFFFPSQAETFGMALLEAMASGCAIVSSVPLEFAGIPVPACDRTAMINAIRRLWESPEECRSAALRNVEIAKQYTWDRYADAVLGAYSEALGIPPPAALTESMSVVGEQEQLG